MLLCLMLLIPAVSDAKNEVSDAQPADSLKSSKPKYIWKGEANIEAGSNFHLTKGNKKTHNIGKFGAKAGFTRDKFAMDIATSVSQDHKLSGRFGGNVNVEDGDTTRKIDASTNENTKLNTESSLKLEWNPGKNHYGAYYSYEFNSRKPTNFNITTSGSGSLKRELESSLEKGDKHSNRHRFGFGYEHSFSGGEKVLNVTYDHEIYAYDEYSEWITGEIQGNGISIDNQGIGIVADNIDAGEASRYRSTPSSNYNDGVLAAVYASRNLFKIKGLGAEFGLNFHINNLLEYNSAANYIKGVWVDSIAARENFHYRTISMTPFAKLRYERGIYALALTMSPEYFAYKLDGDSHVGDINRGKVANLFELTGTFKLWQHHAISLNLKRYDDRPDYLMICWFPRYSSIYANEIYVGNPDLNNSVNINTKLTYSYSFKGISANLELCDEYMPKKIAKTYNNEIYDGKEYRVYTWINGGKSNDFKVLLSGGWKGEHLYFFLGGEYSYYWGLSASGNETRSTEYSFKTQAKYSFKDWSFEGNAKYQSGINRSYFSISSIIDGNFKITKRFGKHLSMFLYGQNLMDRPVLVETRSEDLSEIRYEKYIDYKRLVKLGVTYKF